jgi:hypothetical protein
LHRGKLRRSACALSGKLAGCLARTGDVERLRFASPDIIAGQVVGVSRRPHVEDKNFFRLASR